MTPNGERAVANRLVARGVGKAYKRYAHKSARLVEWLGFGPRHELRWAVRDVSFEVGEGEAFAIVGANGSGKSTLLKLIAGTTSRTTGDIEVCGSVSALHELGLGFHPEFTGRQNAVMAASLRGLSTAELAERMSDIEAFADIGDFMGQPVRTFSSGMQARLAFSVATATRPDLLIIDEALAVGDRLFSHKCMARIRQFVDQGTTLLFVSHDTNAVKSLCRRALLLERGRVVALGEVGHVVDIYVGLALKEESKRALVVMPVAASPPASAAPAFPEGFEPTHAQVDSGDVAIDGFTMHSERGESVRHACSGDMVTFEYRVRTRRDLDDPHFGISIRTRHGLSIFNTNSFALGRQNPPLAAGTTTRIAFRMRLPLTPDHYGVCVGVANGGFADFSFREYLNNTINIDVIEVLRAPDGVRFGGLVDSGYRRRWHNHRSCCCELRHRDPGGKGRRGDHADPRPWIRGVSVTKVRGIDRRVSGDVLHAVGRLGDRRAEAVAFSRLRPQRNEVSVAPETSTVALPA